MYKNTDNTHWLWIAALITLLALSRFIPHPPNFTPIGAMAILSGIMLKDYKLALLIPLSAMLLSDIFLGIHSSMLFVYAAIVLIIFTSKFFVNTISILNLAVSGIFAAVIFFLITNFGAWLSHDMYPHSASGLMQAYVAGIPFFRNTLLANLFFLAISFYIVSLLPAKKLTRTA